MSLNNIIDTVSQVTGIPTNEIIGRSRMMEISDARNLFTALACERGFGLKPIGRFLDKRHHTTVISARQRAKDLCFADMNFKRNYDTAKQLINKEYANVV